MHTAHAHKNLLTQLTQPGIDRCSATAAPPVKRQRVLSHSFVVIKRADLGSCLSTVPPPSPASTSQYVSRGVVLYCSRTAKRFKTRVRTEIFWADVLVKSMPVINCWCSVDENNTIGCVCGTAAWDMRQAPTPDRGSTEIMRALFIYADGGSVVRCRLSDGAAGTTERARPLN